MLEGLLRHLKTRHTLPRYAASPEELAAFQTWLDSETTRLNAESAAASTRLRAADDADIQRAVEAELTGLERLHVQLRQGANEVRAGMTAPLRIQRQYSASRSRHLGRVSDEHARCDRVTLQGPP